MSATDSPSAPDEAPAKFSAQLRHHLQELTDDSLPAGSGLVPTVTRPPFDPKAHKAKTRKLLALSALAAFAIFHLGLVTLLACDVLTLQELTGIVAASTGFQTLAAVAFTFYFAKA